MEIEPNYVAEQTIEVFSNYLKEKVILIDNCGCINGGFYEKEFTQHYFMGQKSTWVKFYCDKCNSELKTIIKAQNENA